MIRLKLFKLKALLCVCICVLGKIRSKISLCRLTSVSRSCFHLNILNVIKMVKKYILCKAIEIQLVIEYCVLF